MSAWVRWGCCVRRCGPRRRTACPIGRRGWLPCARLRRCSQELKPVEEPGPEPTIVVYDLPPGSTSVTHRADGRSSEDTSGDERLPEAAEPAAEESQTQHPAWFLYEPTDDIKSSVLIGTWEPARATDNTEAVVSVKVVTTDDRETADRWRAELAAGRYPAMADGL